MELVLDANIIFSALIKDSHTRHFLILSNHSFYTPEFVLDEVRKHSLELEEKTGLSREELQTILDEVITLADINLVLSQALKDYLQEAKEISPDLDDAPYFALALKLNCAIWSNDKELKNQNQVKIYSTPELFALF